jgi:MFS family permease
MKKNNVELITIKMLLAVAFFNGFTACLMNTQDVIAKKALLAADWQITFLTMIWPVSNFFSIWWGKILQQSKSRSKYFWITAFVGRLPLLLAVYVYTVNQFIGLLALFYSFNALLLPAQNSLMQTNLSPKIRGSVFGKMVSLTTIIALVVTFFAGRILDNNSQYFHYLVMFFGICGFISSLILGLIPFKVKDPIKKQPVKDLIIKPLTDTITLLKEDKQFALFQRNFFIYGIGYLIVIPVIPKLLVQQLNMTYTTTFLAKGVVSQLGLLLLSPLAGKLHDKRNPALFSSISFGALALYPIFLLLANINGTTNIAYIFVFIAYAIFGIAMSGINISWNISSIYFAGQKDASVYQSVHITLTGLRGLFVPIIGYIVMTYLSLNAVFIIASLALITASILSYKLNLSISGNQ